MFKPRAKKQEQKRFWVVADRLPKASPGRFYQMLNETLEAMEFGSQVRLMCEPAYADVTRGGRPGIDPEVYFKMLMVGFFEGFDSERQIAARCADSLSLRGFLGYALDEATPEHSSLTVIRQRLGGECYERVFALVLEALQRRGLLKGKHLGIDSSVIEANASLRNLSERNTQEAYWDYVKRLARQAGLETDDGAALRNFDRKRSGKKLSNEQWQSPSDPEAKIGRTKHGATDMVYLPEHTVDLETGTIVQAQVLAGDHRDSEQLSERVIEAAINVQEAMGTINPQSMPETMTADKGYFSLEEIGLLQELGIKTVISDPHRAQRRMDKLSRSQCQCLARAQRSTRSKYGKRLLARRGQHIERSFAHVLDAGGMRRATLRGLENLNKRHKIAAACYNLSQLLRHLHGVGTPKQWLTRLYCALLCELRQLFIATYPSTLPKHHRLLIHSWHCSPITRMAENQCSSTAC
jgi:transposase